MPRFFFDIRVGSAVSVDSEGQEMDSPEAARVEAMAVLPELIRGLPSDGDEQSFASIVRDESGAAIYEATLKLRCDRLG